MENRLLCGAAKGDITPLPEELDGLEALMRKKFGGISDRLYVRAIVVKNGEEDALFLCFELDKAPYPELYQKEIAGKFHIREDHIFLLAVHAHAVPITGDRIYDGPNNIACKPQHVAEVTHAYEGRMHETVLRTVGQAYAALQPVVMGITTAESYINVDRRKSYHVREISGEEYEITAVGNSPEKPVDHTVTEIGFRTPEGAPIAFILHYPVHCTVMHGNQAADGKMAISSDLAGRTCICVEKEYQNAVCMWISGAAGNVNPIMQCEMTYPDPETGKPVLEYLPGDVTGILRNLSAVHYQDVRKGLHNLKCAEKNIQLKHEVRLCKSKGKKGVYTVRLHMMRLGTLYVLSVSGELYASYAERAKRVTGEPNLIVVNHDCSNAYDSGYIADVETMMAERVQLPGAGEQANILPEYFEQAFLQDVKKMYENLA